MNLTRKELEAWKEQWERGGTTYTKDNVHIYPYRSSDGKPLFTLFKYGNLRGILHPDNGYLGNQPDGKDYYPLVRISLSLTDESRFNPTVEPNLDGIVKAIINLCNNYVNSLLPK